MASPDVQYRIYLVILFLVFFIGMLGLIFIEHFPPLDAFYFIVTTVSTVGYGDLHPVTPVGKLLVIIIIFAGVGCFVGVVVNSIEYVITKKERALARKKLNMIIGVFFSEVGTQLLKNFSAHDPALEEIRSALIVANHWSDSDFSRAAGNIKDHPRQLDSHTIDLEELNRFLTNQKGFLLSLLENPQMTEHDSFIPLLLAVFHLTEELTVRDTLTDLPPSDYGHLSGDINRIYGSLVIEWLAYMKQLKIEYPHMFSLAMRMNPFDADASPIVK
jgi:hypothetical protein